jgi:hypothetical protein
MVRNGRNIYTRIQIYSHSKCELYQRYTTLLYARYTDFVIRNGLYNALYNVLYRRYTCRVSDARQ